MSDAVTDDTWRAALGDERRIGDWTACLRRQVAEAPWRDVLLTWWPRLLPGIVPGWSDSLARAGDPDVLAAAAGVATLIGSVN